MLISCSCASAANGQQPEPVMDFATLLTSFGVRPNGVLQLENNNEPLTTVFLPHSVPPEAVITRAGSNTPLHIQDFYKGDKNKIFAYIQSRGKYKEFRFTEPGDYVLTYQAGNKVMTQRILDS